ncbi:MAG: type II toxin-antitoxin system HicB family antitoxin [Elusimicrobia bacterium]|nr:type II toxin-antitoxin system HicB family antitoxin [Elusimicrobiota bacterium]
MELNKYHVVLESEPEMGGFSVYVPALPGCASQGETEKDALENIREAISVHLEGLKKDGIPIPEDREVTTKEVEVARA